MTSDRMRVLLPALAALALIVLSLFVLDWFVLKLDAPLSAQVDKVVFDLRSIKACQPGGICVSFELSKLPILSQLGTYSTIAPATFWVTLGWAGVLAYVTGARLVAGYVGEGWIKLGQGLGVIVVLTSVSCGFLFSPDVPALAIQRTLAPFLLVAACGLGFVAVHFAGREAMPDTTSAAGDVRAIATARLAGGHAHGHVDARVSLEPPQVSRTPTLSIPAVLRGRLSFATLTAELSRAGIDARREDGESRLVLWRDLGGVVVRRLPPDPPYDGVAFVDLVSTAGSTLRILPWTRMSGDPVDDDPVERPRSLAKLVVARCPEIQVDRATRAFLEGEGPPAQLPDAAMLAAHDARLA